MQINYLLVSLTLLLYISLSEADLCPDKKSVCPDGSTCCELPTGGYGCCPLVKAVCCSDGIHCCPNGYTCDIQHGRCDKVDNGLDIVPRPPSKNSIICPGGLYQCPNGNTCCPSGFGTWNCCPMVAAVCCADYVHCCPYGTFCDVRRGVCMRGDGIMTDSVPWSEKFEAEIVDEPQISAHKLTYPVNKDDVKDDVQCPGSTKKTCPEDNTCCEDRNGKYRCCPYPEAICCADKKHCCPLGTACIKGQCYGKSGESKSPLQLLKPVKESACSGASDTGCPGDGPCCQRKSGEWGCCPFQEGICCGDGEHCCPSGFTCDLDSHHCTKANSKVPKKSIFWT